MKKTKMIYPMTDTADRLGITAENYPKVDGSKLMQGLADHLYKSMHGVVDPYGYRHSRTIPAYEKLTLGETDLILVPDVPEDVLQSAADAGVTLESYEIAREGMVFLTSSENKASNITMAQAQAVYGQDAIRNWTELGGTDRELVPFCGDRSTNDLQLQLELFVLQGASLAESIQNSGVLPDLNEMYWAMAEPIAGGYPLGVGYYTSPDDAVLVPEGSVKILSFDGVAPTGETIADGSYPLTYSYYAVFRADLPADHPVRTLVQWLQTEEGKAMIENSQQIVPAG